MRNALIVDDEKIIRKHNCDLLKARGYETFEAENGHAASLMMIGNTKMGLVLMDISIPVVGGPALVDIIKLCSPETKIVVSSAYPLDDQKRMISNADAYHQKSEGKEMLMSRIESAMPKETSHIKKQKRKISRSCGETRFFR